MYPAAPEKSGSTTIAGVLAIIVSSIWGLFGGLMLLGGALFTTADNDFDDEVGFDSLADVIGGALIVVGAIVLGFAIWSIVLGVQVLKRRNWARVTAMIFFTLYGLLGVLSLAGSTEDTSSRFDDDEEVGGVAVGVAILASDLLIVILLALPSTGRDIKAHEQARLSGGAGQAGYGYAAPAGWTQPAAPPPGQWGATPPTGPPPPPGDWGAPPPPGPPPPPPPGAF